jgi:hypothetical protein
MCAASHGHRSPCATSLSCTPRVVLTSRLERDSQYRAQWERVSVGEDELAAHR